jgi:hypothetical protein
MCFEESVSSVRRYFVECEGSAPRAEGREHYEKLLPSHVPSIKVGKYFTTKINDFHSQIDKQFKSRQPLYNN